jgi:hypothetical protein
MAAMGNGGAVGSAETSGLEGAGGPPDAGEAGAGGDAGSVPSPDEVCREAVTAYCQRFEECLYARIGGA